MEVGLPLPTFSFLGPAPFPSGPVTSPILAQSPPHHAPPTNAASARLAPPPFPDGPALSWTEPTTCGCNCGGSVDARGAAESQSGSAFSAAPAGDAVDFRLPVDWKNLLKTACLADAGLEEAGFRRDIARPGVNSPRAGPSRARGPAAAVPGASADASTS